MKKVFTYTSIIILLITSVIAGGSLLLSSTLNSSTPQYSIAAGDTLCRLENFTNTQDSKAIITDIVHTGTPDLIGIDITVYNVTFTGNDDFIKNGETQPPFTVEPGETFHFYICYDTDFYLKPETYTFFVHYNNDTALDEESFNVRTNFIIEESEEPIDDTPPTVSIAKPESNSLYVFNRKIHSNFCFKTMILGSIDINTIVIDESGTGIDRVEFFINDDLRKTLDTKPYVYRWSDICFGLHTIRVDVYDNNANMASESITVFKIF